MDIKLNSHMQEHIRVGFILGFFLYLMVPVIYHSSTALQRYLIFKHDSPLPPELNFSHPERENLFGAHNRYIPSSANGSIGMWQVLPNDIYLNERDNIPSDDKDQWFLKTLTDDRPVVLYCHGNYPSRANDHRVLVLKLLQALNYHVITFDYRGYADSTSIRPSEVSVTTDVLDVIDWIRLRSSSPLFVWAHSLGTAISLSALAKLSQTGTCVDALILQSGFSSITDEIESQTIVSLYKMLPFYEWIFVEPLYEQDIRFDSKANILKLPCPILILHAEDDVVVPFDLGKTLYEVARDYQAKQGTMRVTFVPFSASYGYGHNGIVAHPGLPVMVKEFYDDAMKSKSWF